MPSNISDQAYRMPPATLEPAFSVTGVRTRRVFAFFVDSLIIFSFICMLFVLAVIFAIPTFGFSFLALFISLPVLMPAIALLYNGVTVSGQSRGTIGMRLFEIEVSARDGGTPSFIQAAAHAVLFYLPAIVFVDPHAVFLLLLFLPTFIDGQKRMLHDILLGLVVARRPGYPAIMPRNA